MVSKELNSVFDQVARCSAVLNVEGRAIVIGVGGLDAGVNVGLATALKTNFEAAGTAAAIFHLERCVDTAVCADLVKAAGSGSLSADEVHRYLDEGIDYDNARTAIQDLTADEGVLIVEGVLLYTGALSDLFDLRLFLDVEVATARARLDSVKPPCSESVFDTMVVPAYEHYLQEYDPASTADLVIDYNDACMPKIIVSVG